MATWRKVIVSGSNAELNQISASGNIVPVTDNTQTLGTAAKPFGDLFLGSGGVINLHNGDVTLTHTSNLVTITGGSTRVDKLEIDSANDHIDVSTDMVITSAQDITLTPGGANVKPGSESAIDLGVSGTAFRTLFVDSIEMNGQGNLIDVVNITGSGHVSMSNTSTGSFGRLEIAGDATINGNLTFGDADTDSVSFGAEIDSNLIPNIDDTYDLGSSAKAWQDLFLEGDITLTDAGTVKTAAGALTIDGAGGVNIQEGSATVISIDDSQNLVLNNISGKTVTIGHTTSETTVSDNLTVTGNASIGGNATITGNLDVNGTLTTIDTTNLAIKDQLVIIASGSQSSNVDGGILVQSGSVANSGSAFYHDTDSERWAVAKQIAASAVAITPDQFMVTVTLNSSAPSDSDGQYGVGEMWVETDTQDIFIRTN